MLASELIENLKPRVQRLGLVDAQTGFYDQDELLVYVNLAAKYLAQRYQLQHFLESDTTFITTTANIEIYTLPETYGFWSPEETRRSGLFVSDLGGANQSNLYYYDIARYNLIRTTATTGRPAWFTIVSNQLYLQPVPDAAYRIGAINRPVQDVVLTSDLPAAYEAAISIETLWRMASDQNKATQLLAAERVEILRTIVNNESRIRQRFYTSYERPGFNRGRRRYGY